MKLINLDEASGGKGIDMAEVMTDKQFDKILKMVSMILEGCKDLDEAKEKVRELVDERKKRNRRIILFLYGDGSACLRKLTSFLLTVNSNIPIYQSKNKQKCIRYIV